MTYIMVDVEADGPIPCDYSMISLGAVVVEFGEKRKFYTEIKPISEKWVPEALAVSGFTREQTMTFLDAKTAMQNFADWLKSLKCDRLMFMSDNNGFDWQWVNWYFHHFLGNNPFGHSSGNLGQLWKGYQRDMFANFKRLRETKHTHNACDDAMGNAEAMLKVLNIGNFKWNKK